LHKKPSCFDGQNYNLQFGFSSRQTPASSADFSITAILLRVSRALTTRSGADRIPHSEGLLLCYRFMNAQQAIDGSTVVTLFPPIDMSQIDSSRDSQYLTRPPNKRFCAGPRSAFVFCHHHPVWRPVLRGSCDRQKRWPT
jgi:hypothetical protein